MPAFKPVIVTTTAPTREEAEKIGSLLLEKQLAVLLDKDEADNHRRLAERFGKVRQFGALDLQQAVNGRDGVLRNADETTRASFVKIPLLQKR